MNRSRTIRGAVLLTIAVMLLTGCGGGAVSHEWEIVAENRSDTPINVIVAHGIKTSGGQSQGSASINNLGKGKPVSLIVGPGKTVVKTVKVTRNGEAQELIPEAELEPGKKFVVLVGADGKASGSVSNR